jgi:hypothetical protein
MTDRPGTDPRSAACAALRTALESRAAGDERPVGCDLASHLQSCETCRALAARTDPTVFFAPLAFERKDEGFWLGFETGVLAKVREDQARGKGILRFSLWPRWAALAAGASVLALAVLALRPGGGGPFDHTGRRAATVPMAGTTETVIASAAAPAGAALLLERDVAAPAPVETISSPTAKVLSIRVGKGKEDTEESDVVVIVDQGIDI